MIIRARIVVTMDGLPTENGAVVVTGDRIVEVGTFPEIAKRHSPEEVVDLGDRALLPGLINAHCHLDYSCLRGKIPPQKSFTDWIKSINAAKAELSADDYVGSIQDGLAEAKRFGTTAIANLTAFPALVSQIESPIRTWWCAELIDVRDPGRAAESVERAVEQLKWTLDVGETSPLSKRGQIRALQHWGLAPHAPYTASRNLYRRCEEIGARENVPLTTHLAESREEMEMFRDARGPLYDFLKQIGRDMSDCDGKTPIERAIEDTTSPARTPPFVFVHVNELIESDFDLLGKRAETSSIVHCPRSHAYFGHSPFQFHKLRDIGCNICLGTDSLASNDDLSLFAEMRAFQEQFPGVRPEHIFEMVTVNAARALGPGNWIGKVGQKFSADLIAIPISSQSLFEEIVAFDGPVDWLMVGGRILA
jgi:cytosine/adenosine deaminase-related metal-dependent hydrolase